MKPSDPAFPPNNPGISARLYVATQLIPRNKFIDMDVKDLQYYLDQADVLINLDHLATVNARGQ